MTHVVVGHPSIKVTEELILLMDKVEVDFIELQIPFSDPLADGPTIMKACEESLKKARGHAEEAHQESITRRLGLAISTILLTLLVIALAFKIRSLPLKK